MTELSNLNKQIVNFIAGKPMVSSKDIHEGILTKIGYATIKRALQLLIAQKLIMSTGQGKATKYQLSPAYFLLNEIDQETYFKKEIDEREIITDFDLQLITEKLKVYEIFTHVEQERLDSLQKLFKENIAELSSEEYKREFERLAIDLSWKSSQIEGNTYSLLETERLLKEQETASGKTKDEASMLLNHKAALDFILGNVDYIHPLTISRIEDLHSILMKDLNVGRNIRKRRVGISGTNYKPLDNEFQIREAFQAMCDLINSKENVFEQALLALVLISYIQPFEDGNKRTARIISNAILMHQGNCPLSFRTIDSIDYKKAMLIFYEQNNISVFKRIFIEQYDFAVKTYF